MRFYFYAPAKTLHCGAHFSLVNDFVKYDSKTLIACQPELFVTFAIWHEIMLIALLTYSWQHSNIAISANAFNN